VDALVETDTHRLQLEALRRFLAEVVGGQEGQLP
jgi:hypothetical protein